MKPAQTIGLAAVLVAVLIWPCGVATTAARTDRIDGQSAAQTAPATDLTGTYKLVAIDGHDLPYALTHDDQPSPTVTAGSLTLNKDASVLSSMSVLLPGGQTMTRDVKGAYTRQGTTLEVIWEGAGRTAVTIDGQVLTMNNEGTFFRYKKS